MLKESFCHATNSPTTLLDLSKMIAYVGPSDGVVHSRSLESPLLSSIPRLPATSSATVGTAGAHSKNACRPRVRSRLGCHPHRSGSMTSALQPSNGLSGSNHGQRNSSHSSGSSHRLDAHSMPRAPPSRGARRDGEPLRVAFFTPSYFVLDGVTLTIRKLMAALKASGAECMVVTAAPLALDTCAELGSLEHGENLVLVPGMPVPFESGNTYGYAMGLGLSRDAQKQLEAFNPHVAHFTVCDLLGMDGVAWAKRHNVAMVGTWHSNYCEYIKFYSGASWVVPVLRRYMQQFYGGIPTTFVPTEFMRLKLTDEGYHHFTDMQIWGRGLDLERFDPSLRRSEEFRRKIGVAPHEVCLIWVGRLVPEKRPDIWRDVYLALLAEGFPVKGLVVGVGPCQVMFDACPGVTVAGWLNGVDLAEAYASADLLLFPSDVETFGNVTLEALGSGIPAVVERNCSAHLVTDGEEGFAVPHDIADPKDKGAYDRAVERYLEAARKLVADPALRASCGAKALAKAATFSNATVQQRMVDNYHEAFAAQVMISERSRLATDDDDPNAKSVSLGVSSRHGSKLLQWGAVCLQWQCAARMRRWRQLALHSFFQVVARIVIFITWLLLGMPTVTSTDLEANGKIRQADEVTTVEV